jgi:4-aminobutyrate aminotransferase-like enzyme/Ser/Thr protein kinase RdoA (MazF antagonist)
LLIEARGQPKFSSEDAVRIARELYGIEACASPVPGEFDDNFHLVAGRGEYLLKILRPGCERAFLDLQEQVLARLEGLPVPRAAGAVSASDGHFVWLLDWLPGELLARIHPPTPEMLEQLGRLLGEIDSRLSGFSHPAALREFKWDLKRAGWIRDYLSFIADPARRALVEKILARYDAEIVPELSKLRHGVIHGDANDHNILVDRGKIRLIDFGDVHYTVTVAEIAIACAYAACWRGDPMDSILAVLRGYSRVFPLEEREIELLFPLLLARLAVSVTNSSYLSTIRPDPYVTVSEQHAWRAIEKLSAIHPRLAHYRLRGACRLEPSPRTPSVIAAVRDLKSMPLVPPGKSIVFDLSFSSTLLAADPKSYETAPLAETLWQEMRRAGATIGIGRYDEARPIYTAPEFAAGPRETDEHRTIHIGLDLFCEPGTPVFAPLAGKVHAFANRDRRLDYGPVILLRHDAGFFTLYGHLTRDSLENLRVGQPVEAGQAFAKIGAPPENGGWPPHLHFQIIVDDLDLGTDFPGVAFAAQREVWKSLSPDPRLIADGPDFREPSISETLEARRVLLGRNLSVSYERPLKIVRGWRQYLYDENGRAYLDVYNNVPLVGHSHPRVAEAVARQISVLNTNTRYLHDKIVEYASKLTQLLPEPLRVCYFLNSASEANELALRLARARLGREETLVLEHAYHGHTNTLIDISPYKFDGPGGRGRKPWVRVAPLPDPRKRDDPAAGLEYARAAAGQIDGPAAFIAESLPSVGGQVVFPPGYLREVYGAVRAAGGVCIADEVQTGFGRLGDYFWGFQMQDVVPDIVVLGKPMGNAFPLAGVVTTPEIAEAFDNGMEFFSTYGGNPVACAAGLAVLDVLRQERLPENAARVGRYLMELLRKLNVADVRGRGLFLGIELSTGEHAAYVVNRLRERGILAGTDGPLHNVIKIRPPLIFSEEDAEFFASVLGEILEENFENSAVRTPALPLRPGR